MSRSRSHSSVGPSSGTNVHPVVNTSPPWARDKTPSPVAECDDLYLTNVARGISNTGYNHPTSSDSLDRGSWTAWDAASTDTHATKKPGNRWWAFARPRRPLPVDPPSVDDGILRPSTTVVPLGDEDTHLPIKERLRASWFAESVAADRWRSRRRQNTHPSAPTSQPASPDNEGQQGPSPMTQGTPNPRLNSLRRELGLQLEMPPQQPEPALTLAHTQTPGWESPWAPHLRTVSLVNNRALPNVNEEVGPHNGHESPSQGEDGEFGHRNRWTRRKKKFRHFCLHHNYVPLIFRLLNLVATTCTMGVAIRERRLELNNNVLGAIGSSITLVIIFAPLTIVHVLIAIYLEYLGRPLGLWRTSMKLLYTLFETVFICMWSAALSLCFDNYFTSPLRCVPVSDLDWWNQLPRPTNPLGVNVEHSLSDDLCSHTIALIVLIFFALVTYCSSLFISLFRIFEKVKYRTATDPA